MDKDIKVSIISGLIGAIAGITGAIVSGYFLLASQYNKQSYEKERFQIEQEFALRKEMRDLAAEYSAIVDKIYMSIRSGQLQNSTADLTQLKISIEKIKYLGSPKITNAANKLSIALFDYFNKFSSENSKELHDKFVDESANWTITMRQYFEDKI